jgi:transposase
VKLCVEKGNHDNAPAHKVLCVKQFLGQKSITEVEQSPYFPDLAPNNLWLFSKNKVLLKGTKISWY